MRKPQTRWTADTETAFLLALRQTGTTRAAAAMIGRDKAGAYARRGRDPDFAARWDAMVAEWRAEAAAKETGGGGPLARNVRWDGFSEVRQRAFLRALSETGETQKACERVGVAHETIRKLKQRSPEFVAACEKALRISLPCLEQIAYERAVEGWDEEIVLRGEVVGTRHRWSERLLADLLKAELAARKVERAEAAKRGPVEEPTTREDMMSVLLKRIDLIESRRKHKARREALEAAERWEAIVRAGGLPGLGGPEAIGEGAGDGTAAAGVRAI
jgi:hypothetical protein